MYTVCVTHLTDKTLLPGQTEEIRTEGSPTCKLCIILVFLLHHSSLIDPRLYTGNITTQDNRSKPPPRERNDSTSSSGYSTGNSDDHIIISNSSNSLNASDGEDEGSSDGG